MGKSSRSASRATDGSELLQVKPGRVLPWPASAGATARGEHGTVVRRDDPLAEPFFHLLEAAPAGVRVSAHSNALADREYRRLGYEHAPPFEPAQDAKPEAKPARAAPPREPAAPAGDTETDPKPPADAGDATA